MCSAVLPSTRRFAGVALAALAVLLPGAALARHQDSRTPAGAVVALHPFPAPDIFEKLPWRKQILRALLHYDLLGFQTERDRYNFVSCLERIVPEAISTRDDPFNTIELEDRRTRVGTFPISIGFEEFANHAASREVELAANQFRHELGNKFLVLGVDRMDYTKGIPERL